MRRMDGKGYVDNAILVNRSAVSVIANFSESSGEVKLKI